MSKNLCLAHYQQDYSGMELRPLRWVKKSSLRAVKRPCAFQGCTNMARSATGKGVLCSGHLHQKRTGKELYAINSKKGRASYVTVYGYRMITVDGRSTPEHRAVMANTIGRPLLRRETVHHINGDKLDNRPENLELWVSAHQRGQRVEDLVDFVVNTYPDLVEKRLRQPLLFVA